MAIIYKTFHTARTAFCFFFACFLVAALAFAPAFAQDNLFKVEGVKVDVTADSALAARDQAFEKAQIDAFTVLAGRMLIESELANFKAPDIAAVSAMVQDYEVTQEKLSSVRYIGTYTITFRQKAVERFFNKQGSSYTNVVSAPLVVLPFYQVNSRTYLWSPYNFWMKAWNRAPAQSVPVPLIIPIGDLEDVSDIGDDDVFGYDPDKLVALLKRYDAGDAVLAVATPDGKLGPLNENDNAAGGSVTVSLYRTDRGHPEHVQEIVVEALNTDTLGRLLDRAVIEAQARLKENWKEKTVVNASPDVSAVTDNTLIARIRIKSLEEWATTQRALARVNAISSTSLKSLSPREALVELHFRGDEQMLRQALAQSGMDLSFPQYSPGDYGAEPGRLVYDLSIGGRPVVQPRPYQTPSYQPPAQPQGNVQGQGYQQQKNIPPRQQITDRSPEGYPLPGRSENPGYSSQF